MTDHSEKLNRGKRPKRSRQRGANLAILCAVGLLILALVGISLYSGIQTYVESDLQRASMNAAMSGAAAYYTGAGTGASISPNVTIATGVATSTFNNIIKNTSLEGFQASITQITNNDNNDSITVASKAQFSTPFLAPVGIKTLSTTTTSTARALKYEPTLFTGPIKILPVGGNIASYSKKLMLAFPLVDGPGNDLYVEQPESQQMAYIVEGCNSTQCYNLVPGATSVGKGKIVSLPDGSLALIGSAVIDIARAGIHKASILRFVHGNNFNTYSKGTFVGPQFTETPLVIQRVMLFGYAGACVSSDNCPVPAGFSPVE